MRDTATNEAIAAALAAKGPDYLPRTRHKLADGSPRYTNRLILASSPYLAQHAHNPVDWWLWCDEAFSTAETQSKPVLLSVGYSTCHWCHVMEEESFEDEEIARFVNERFVCVKVDREERPDVDAVYMSFIQGMTGRGGWPMTVFLTPSRQPFYGATYLPPRAGARGARQGLLEVLRIIDERYRGDPRAILAQSELYSNELRTLSRPAPAGDLAPSSTFDAAVAQARASFDPTHGGRRGIPKFPSAFPLRLLCRYGVRSRDERVLSMVSHTLERMADGGMFDHLCGGFHRYSTDHQWLVPHFEKMLYDNAALALAYLEGSQALANPRFAGTTRSVLDYVLAEMTAPDGTFYAATDADSATPAGVMEEGAFFTWTTHEIESALGVDDAPDAIAYWGVSETGHLDGRSVLHRPRDAPSLDPSRVESLRARLFEARAKRPAPLRDDKAIIGWNALTVTTLARGAIVLGDARYGEAAVRCCDTILRVRDQQTALPHVIVRGQGEGLAYGDDRVFLAQALLDVFELTGQTRWLDEARATMNDLEREHSDPENGGYFLSGTPHEALLFREKPDYDGAVPSLNSVAALVWARLATVCDDELARGHAERTMRAFSALVARRPLAMDHMLLALDWHTHGAREVVIVVREGDALSEDARPFLAKFEQMLVANVALVVGTEASLAGALGERVPFARGKTLLEGRPTAYVCERGLCQKPTADPEEFASQLRAS